MPKMIDRVGKHYGRLIVIGRDNRSKENGAEWLCQCDCGKKTTVRGKYLQSGKTRSCGCLKQEYYESCTLPEGQAGLNYLFCKMQVLAKRRGHTWGLSKEQVQLLTKRKCHYCGVQPKQESQGPHSNDIYLYNGLDRIDSSKGYIIDNVVPCCWRCNKAKNDTPIDEFKTWISTVYEHSVKNTGLA